jgi:hypothetical protein
MIPADAFGIVDDGDEGGCNNNSLDRGCASLDRFQDPHRAEDGRVNEVPLGVGGIIVVWRRSVDLQDI